MCFDAFWPFIFVFWGACQQYCVCGVRLACFWAYFLCFLFLIFSKLFRNLKSWKPLLNFCIVCMYCFVPSGCVFSVLQVFFKKTCAHFANISGIVLSFYYIYVALCVSFISFALDYRAVIAHPIVLKIFFKKAKK